MKPFDPIKFGQLLSAPESLVERLPYDRLFQYSEPKRVARSNDVRGPSLQVDALKDGFAWYFNARSYATNTTGLRQKCYIHFFRPLNPNLPLEKVDCEVDCTCPDYRYMWAWANKQRGSGSVGPRSLNKAWNQAPRIKNPGNVPGLCKHLLALRDFIYGKYSTWNWGGMDTPTRLDKLVRYADKRVIRGETLAAQQANLAARKATQTVPDSDVRPGKPVALGPKDEPKGAEKKTPTGHRGPSLGGIQPNLHDSVVRHMDAQPILDDLAIVEAEVKDAELLKLLREFFTIFKKLADEVEPEKDDDAAKLALPADAKEVSPVTGKEETGEEDEASEKKELEGQPVPA